MTLQEIKSKIEKAVQGTSIRIVRDALVIEPASRLRDIAAFLKTNDEFKMDYLSSITAVDYIQYLESVYHFYSMEKKTGPVILKVRVTRQQPGVPSLVPLYHGAELQERENFDLFGIVYEGHPNFKRLFMWDGFEGHPMRKDYLQEDSEILEAEDIAWLDQHGVKIPEAMRKTAEELKTQGKRAVAQKEGKEKA